jgi:hypothetical protein
LRGGESREEEIGAPIDAKLAFAFGCALIVLAVNVEIAEVTWALAPLFTGSFIFAALRSPLRSSLYVVMFFALVLENPIDHIAGGNWHTPGSWVGTVYFLHLKNTTGISFLFLSPLEYALFFLLVLSYFRKRSGSRLDAAGRTYAPRELMRLALLSLGTSLWMAFYGAVRGGNTSFTLWQLDKVVYVPILALLFNTALRGPRDIVSLGRVVLIAGAYRAGLAVYIRNYVEAPMAPWGERFELETATSHHDSMLFAAAALLLILPVVERVGKGSLRRLLLGLPLLVWGMIANDRRMAWVLITIVLFTLYMVTPPNKIKRRIRNALIFLSPAIAAYVAVGWNIPGNPAFKPVGIIKSVVEPATDASSLWREIENYDLLFTFRQGPIFGQGYGFRFWEIISLPPVNYPLEPYCPHNAIFGIWAFGGYVGYTGLMLSWAGCVYFAMLAYRHTRVPLERVAAIMCMGSILIYMIQSYGDVGLGAWPGVFLVAPSIPMAGKLAVCSGGWRKKN